MQIIECVVHVINKNSLLHLRRILDTSFGSVIFTLHGNNVLYLH